MATPPTFWEHLYILLVWAYQTLAAQLKQLTRCRHLGAHVSEGKTFCPDCGEGLVFRWAIIKCSQCHMRRASTYRWRVIHPSHNCCTNCGASAYTTQYFNDPEYFQLRNALLSLDERPEETQVLQPLSKVLAEYLSPYKSAPTPKRSPSRTSAPLALLAG